MKARSVAAGDLQHRRCSLRPSIWGIYERLPHEERILAMYRRAGYPWSEIAALMNSSPARLQKLFERAIRRARGLLEP
ncbi:MAG: hypothetical protein EA424_28310 [Planctomycetaceae bacterium]|nr:MAG: hypothetical protein EA424_28310 [Planctomycetaceae bacterium]